MGKQYSREEFAARLGAAERGDPKLNAAADFAARLLSSPVGDSVARIVLFGSVARGEARPESDVDLLVFGAGPLDRLSWAVAESSAETIIDWGESVEPLVYSLSELRVPTSWFLYRTLQIGKEVYRMDENALRYQEALGWLELARDYLEQAESAGQRGHHRLAVDGAYNAAELAVKGALVLKIKDLPTTRGGLVQIFGREYVAKDLADRRYSTRLGRALELRNKARYARAADITDEHVRYVADLARDLMSFLSDQLKQMETNSGNEDPIRD
jgi:predicted nucleotidyltransferase/uncharacterized protein (UPF0332 family)